MNTKQKMLVLSIALLSGCSDQAEHNKAAMQPQLQVPVQQVQQAPQVQYQPQASVAQQPQVQYQQPAQPIIIQQPQAQADSHTDAALAGLAGAAVGYAIAQNNQPPQRSYQDLHRYDRVTQPEPTTIVRERVIIKERVVPAPVVKPTPPVEASRQPQVTVQSAKIPATTVPQAQMQPNKWAGPSTYNSKPTVSVAPPRATSFSSKR
jgi:hypothetical protein